MTRDEAIAQIQLQLSFRTTLSSEIIAQLKLAQTTLEGGPTLPWFLISEDSYARVTPADERLQIPADFLEEAEDAVLRYVPNTVSNTTPEVDLVKDEYDVLRKNYKDLSTGTTRSGPPEAYALFGNYFRIFPTPDLDYLIRMIYFQQDTVLDTNVENGWLKHCPYLLMGKALQQISGGPLRDKDAFQIGIQWEKEGRATLQMRVARRETSNRSLQMGGPH